MKRVLLTGMSGTGKSTVICELAERGYSAVDADSDDYSEWVPVAGDDAVAGSPVEPDRDWVWREDRIEALLAAQSTELLFLSGCAANMGRFLPQFDRVVLLSAPIEVIVERFRLRTNNSYGKKSDEIARVIDLVESVEPLLRRISSHEIDTSAPLSEVIERLLEIAQSAG